MYHLVSSMSHHEKVTLACEKFTMVSVCTIFLLLSDKGSPAAPRSMRMADRMELGRERPRCGVAVADR